MMTPKENFLQTIRGGNPEYLAVDWDGIANILDPASGNSNIKSREPFVDRWGVKWAFPDEKVSRSACALPGGEPVKDISRWREYVTIPNVDDIDFSLARTQAEATDRTREYVSISCVQGLFERLHFLLGFEQSLMAFLEESEYVEEILDVITAHKIDLIQKAWDELKFDILYYHDDWGTKYSLFFSPSVWRRFIRPREARIIRFVRSLNPDALFIHHSDTFLEPLIPGMIEIGIDVWQGCIPQNDLVKLQKEYGGQIGFMGGIDIAAIDHADCPEEAIRTEVRRAIDTYAPHGSFVVGIPSIRAINRNVQTVYEDELRSYAARYNEKHFADK